MKKMMLLLGCSTLSGCYNAARLADIGEVPPMTQIQDPTSYPQYRPVTMPMPTAQAEQRNVNSLWQPGARAFFKDQRAAQIGDVLTVDFSFASNGTITSATTQKRTSTINDNINALMGFESKLGKVFPKGVNPASLVNIANNPSHNGSGNTTRTDAMSNMRLAATVVQILPNGNLVLMGRQEIRLNNEVRELQVQGIARREDIGSDNVVKYDKLAEARFSVGGRGDVTDMQAAPYGQQILNQVLPF